MKSTNFGTLVSCFAIAALVLGSCGEASRAVEDTIADAEHEVKKFNDRRDVENFQTRANTELKKIDDAISESRLKAVGSINATIYEDFGLEQRAAVHKDRSDKALKRADEQRKGILSLVSSIKKSEGVDSKIDMLPTPSGSIHWRNRTYTSEEARSQLKLFAKELRTSEKIRKREAKLFTAYQGAAEALLASIKGLEERRDQLQETILDISAALKIADVEKEIASINSALSGQHVDSDLANLIILANNYISGSKSVTSNSKLISDASSPIRSFDETAQEAPSADDDLLRELWTKGE